MTNKSIERCGLASIHGVLSSGIGQEDLSSHSHLSPTGVCADLTSRRYSEIRAKADYLIALVRLAEAEASILDKHGINVEFVEE